MTSQEFMGLLIASLATLFGLVSVIVALVVKPIINLNKTITKLNAHMERVEHDSGNLNERVTIHGKEIDENKQHLIIHDQEILHIKEEIHKK